MKDFEKSADTVKTIDKGQDFYKQFKLSLLDKQLIEQLEKNGVKISKEDVIKISSLSDTKKLFGWKKEIRMLDLNMF